METLLLPATDPAAIPHAVALLAAGEPVGLPTETVYGLAADALDPTAVARVFEAKERPFFDPLIVHLPDAGWLERVAGPLPSWAAGETVRRLTARFWPGPLTILLPRRGGVLPDLVTAGGPLVAVRRSAHPVFAAVVEAFGNPLAAPSANRFGRISPTSAQHVLGELSGRIALVLDAGPTSHGLESTIVAPQVDGRLRVLRPGPVTGEMLAEVAPLDNVMRASEQAAAPGQTTSHYAPNLPLKLMPVTTASPDTPAPPSPSSPPLPGVGLLAWRRDRPPALAAGRVEFLSRRGDLREAAANLFAALRRLDSTSGLELLWAELVPETGLGVAINERLRRAAAREGQPG